MVYEIILLTLGILAVVEGLLVLIFRDFVKKALREILKKKALVKLAIVEIVIGLIVIVSSLFF